MVSEVSHDTSAQVLRSKLELDHDLDLPPEQGDLVADRREASIHEFRTSMFFDVSLLQISVLLF